jgi:hypothetical protein
VALAAPGCEEGIVAVDARVSAAEFGDSLR